MGGKIKKCDDNRIFDPLSNKCFKKNSQRGKKIQMLINDCLANPDISAYCVKINKAYDTILTRLRRNYKVILIPLISFILYNLFLIRLAKNPFVQNFILGEIFNNTTNKLPVMAYLATKFTVTKIVDPVRQYGGDLLSSGKNITIDSFNALSEMIYNSIPDEILLESEGISPIGETPITMPGGFPSSNKISRVTKRSKSSSSVYYSARSS